MKVRWIQFALTVVCASALTAGVAQTKGIDAALLAKAQAGDAAAQAQVGECYAQGNGVPQSYKQAAVWYLKAANQGNTGAQGTMGMLYSLGLGVPQSDADAYFWLDLAAQAPGPSQARYLANRQNVGTRLTIDELDAIHQREVKWKAAHPQKK